MTNMILTPEQTQGKCPEYNVPKARCKNDSECVAGKIPRKGHGELRYIFSLEFSFWGLLFKFISLDDSGSGR